MLEVADIFRDYGPAWRRANAGHLSLARLKVMSAIENCRTAVLGGHVGARLLRRACQTRPRRGNHCVNDCIEDAYFLFETYPRDSSANVQKFTKALCRAGGLSTNRYWKMAV